MTINKGTRLFIIVLAILIAQGTIKSNNYVIHDVTKHKVIVNRKGELIQLFSPYHNMKVNDSIRLYSDYDMNY